MKAISPVIATVIIVSVAIAISIAVALWLTGITSGFTQTENLQIVSSYANAYNDIQANATAGWIYFNGVNYTSTSGWKVLLNVTTKTNGWDINITVKNTGTVSATIDNIFINNVPLNNAKGVVGYYIQQKTIDPGKTINVQIVIKQPDYSPGQMVNIKIHTASGRDYPTTITLP